MRRDDKILHIGYCTSSKKGPPTLKRHDTSRWVSRKQLFSIHLAPIPALLLLFAKEPVYFRIFCLSWLRLQYVDRAVQGSFDVVLIARTKM